MSPEEPECISSVPSLITVEDVMSQLLWFGHVEYRDNKAYWLETRPYNNGQSSIVYYQNNHIVDVTSPDIDIRSRVYEYGGGDFCTGNNVVYFVRNDEQDLCCVNQSGDIQVILNIQGARFGDLVFSETGHIVCIREQHQNGHVIHDIVAIPLTMPNQVVCIANGHDFVSSVQIDEKNEATEKGENHQEE